MSSAFSLRDYCRAFVGFFSLVVSYRYKSVWIFGGKCAIFKLEGYPSGERIYSYLKEDQSDQEPTFVQLALRHLGKAVAYALSTYHVSPIKDFLDPKSK
ncbi:hypothetical protein QE152_g5999 [Popillia japonica]|uniref:Uncharacterized protein n=1 Tax=Popillia japonica TaxID=7064 RepID=A0AAW1MK68_POPJA